MSAWDREYERRGIPSSSRDEPSGSVLWALGEWRRLRGDDAVPATVLDVGCGTGRNAVALARLGAAAIGLDGSRAAVAAARRRAAADDVAVELHVRDLADGLPAADGAIALALDVFVYKHQIQPEARRRYRAELARVLAPDGLLLLSLARPDDGFYGACPPCDEPGAGPHAVVDPVAGVPSVLFSLEELERELADRFALVAALPKDRPGPMHGRTYERRTLATLWRPLTSPPPGRRSGSRTSSTP